MRRSGDAKEYIAARIAVEDHGYSSPCWIWQKSLHENGYARLGKRLDGERRVHRIAYKLFKGPIAEGLTIDHLCRVKACCNPDHLEAVTTKENNARRDGYQAIPGHCVNGHPDKYRNIHRNCTLCAKEAYRRQVEADPSFRARRAAYMREWNAKRKAA